MKTRIVLADPSDLVLRGLQSVLKDHETVEIVHTTRSTDDLLETLEHPTPDVLIFNERLDPLLDGLALIEQIKQRLSLKMIVLGTVADGMLVRDLFAVGVMGYLYLADDLADCLIPAIRTVLKNRFYLSPTANAEYLVVMQSARRDWQLDAEMQLVLRLLAQGCHMHDIAAQMKTSLRRVYWVREKLRGRFGVTTNEHLVSRAVLEGFTASDV